MARRFLKRVRRKSRSRRRGSAGRRRRSGRIKIGYRF